jgi:predicted metal-dependent hydrolase
MSAEYVYFNQLKVLIHRKPNLRQSRLKISPTGEIEIIAPLKFKDAWVEDFLKASEPWINKTLERFKEFKKNNPNKKYVQGESFYFLGQALPLDFRMSFGTDLKFVPANDSLKVLIPHKRWNTGLLMTPQPWIKEPLKRFFKAYFADLAGQRATHWQNVMGLKPNSLGYRFQKTLWGSCNRQGAVSLNCKLIGAPIDTIDYVIIHEFAHLKHMNHSRDFWKLVEKFSLQHQSHRKWLRQHAPHLEI